MTHGERSLAQVIIYTLAAVTLIVVGFLFIWSRIEPPQTPCVDPTGHYERTCP